jgi:hypothetical protein
MDRLRLKHVTAIALSLWLGFLACVLGCAQPLSATAQSTHRQIFQLKAAANEDAHDRMADVGSCCHHGGKTPEKNRQGTTNVSCCPLDATLIQKQDPVPPLRTYFSVFVLPLLALHASDSLSESIETGAPIPWHAGRDVLLQVHILRI